MREKLLKFQNIKNKIIISSMLSRAQKCLYVLINIIYISDFLKFFNKTIEQLGKKLYQNYKTSLTNKNLKENWILKKKSS